MGSLVVEMSVAQQRVQRLDCSSAPVVISELIESADYLTNARFILVVEKDATFQKLIQEGFLLKFAPAIIVTVVFQRSFDHFNTLSDTL
ncbi:unnamed protein product [Anisakis simplex]|uniref:ANF_receptor domain-containing protein n=1 Tax=Anisakis simplex TaxID=6269 RepID=A0A0M3JQG2_ANISI|nr:unnamed protein product [Anisakis simplex]